MINENLNIIEIRTNPESAAPIAKSIAHLLQQQITIDKMAITVPFGNNVEKVADALGGELIDTVSKPEELLEEFTHEQAVSVVEILSALDSYFDSDDISVLESVLIDAKQTLGEEGAATPFTVLILNGLRKVGMGAEGELRGLVLYDYLKPHLQHQGGYVRFNVVEDGLTNSYTIKVGIRSNSIYFISPATEAAIDFVRQKVVQML